MFGQEARRLGSLIKLLSALQSVHGCGGGGVPTITVMLRRV